MYDYEGPTEPPEDLDMWNRCPDCMAFVKVVPVIGGEEAKNPSDFFAAAYKKLPCKRCMKTLLPMLKVFADGKPHTNGQLARLCGGWGLPAIAWVTVLKRYGFIEPVPYPDELGLGNLDPFNHRITSAGLLYLNQQGTLRYETQ